MKLERKNCSECRWLKYSSPGFYCERHDLQLGPSVQGRAACGAFKPRAFVSGGPARALGPWRYLEVAADEKALLLAILEDRLGTLREQIYHADEPGFKDELRRERNLLAGLILRLKER